MYKLAENNRKSGGSDTYLGAGGGGGGGGGGGWEGGDSRALLPLDVLASLNAVPLSSPLLGPAAAPLPFCGGVEPPRPT